MEKKTKTKRKREKIDLLQTPEDIPEHIKNILASFDDYKNPYTECERLVSQCAVEGYHLDYGLSGIVYDLWVE